ncbi:MAG: TraR/DksA family transcriptional regulator [Candidatus Hydrogenedentota bacterium]|nr:MAG: TraR/DksA family transcriptional regulator [Candidatus Hydrogenedentota bacterium]
MKKKTPYSKKELEEFKKLLLEKKAKIIQDLQEANAESSGVLNEPGDLADMATELLTQEFNLSLTETEKQVLQDIDEALERIKNGTYGICVDTGEVIPKARLKALPEAKRTAAAQEKYDKLMKSRRVTTRMNL